MPQITDYKPPKKFQKKEYRPWNILEEIKKEKNIPFDSKLPANYQQTSSEYDSKLVAIQRLCGLQKEIFTFLMNKKIGESIVITAEELKRRINAQIQTTRNAILRLIKKGFFVRGKGKEGRGGFLVLLVPDPISNAFEEEKKRNEEADSKLVAIREQLWRKKKRK